MLRDLVGRSGRTLIEADVHVVGAGIAGLLAATRLAKAGLRVVVTESGGLHQEGETHDLNEVVHLGSVYQGAEHGRFRCLGGTSTRWGGAMIPFLRSDLVGEGARAWPVTLDEIAGYREEVEAIFQLPPGPYERPDLAESLDGQLPSHVPRLAKWPSFPRRNVARLLDAAIRNPNGPEIWLNATATGFHLAANGRLSAVAAEAPDGSTLEVRAHETVIAAGAIESTRLLLLADRQHEGRLFAPLDVLGRYFHDHLSVCGGVVQPTDRRAMNRLAGFRFEGGGMRNLRFEPAEAPAVRARVPAGFAHLVIASEKGSSFDLLRDLYRQLQKGRLPDPATVLGLTRSLPWLTRALWWRHVEGRLLYPPQAVLELHVVIEQVPRAANRVSLSDSRVDRYGQPLATIDWSVGPVDQANLAAATAAFAEFWQSTTLSRLGTLTLRDETATAAALAEGGGIYHPGGSTRMGTGPANGVVDRDLRSFAVPNLTVASTSTFPSGGGANPTMTMMMFALRAADAVRHRLHG